MTIIDLLIVIIVFGLLFYMVQTLLPLPAPFRTVTQVVLMVLLIVWLLGGLHLGHPLLLHLGR